MMTLLPYDDTNHHHHQQQQPNGNWDITQLSINDLLSLNKNDSDLMQHVLLAKEQENERKSAQEIRQIQENRLKEKYIDYEMQQDFQLSPYSLDLQNNNNNNNNTNNTNNRSDDHWSYPLQANQSLVDHNHHTNDPVLITSSPSQSFSLSDQNYQPIDFFNEPINTSNKNDFAMNPSSSSSSSILLNNYQHQDHNPIVSSHSVTSLPDSISSSHSPLVESAFYSTNNNNNNNNNNSKTIASPTLTSSSSSSLNKYNNSNNNEVGGNGGGGKLIEKKQNKKHKRKQLSTSSLPGFSSSTHVLKWSTNIKRQSQQQKELQLQQQQLQLMNKEPQPPLDHDQVMEALRAKLLKIHSSPSIMENNTSNHQSIASSPTSSSPPPLPSLPTPSPPPPPPPKSPPVNTHPKTGVLFLDLKNKPNRRRKSSPPFSSF